MSTLPPAIMITSTADLVAHVDDWADKALLAIDTESNSLHAYREQVCLIQLSTRDQDFIIDPLHVENLDPLGKLLADPQIEIVFHAADYDLMCLKRDFGFAFDGLFDTMLAARICGSDRLGLGAMLEDFFHIKVNKRYQRANWGERPLTDDMLHYAQLDTHYLPELRNIWRDRLQAAGRWEEAQEAFRELTRTPASEIDFDPDGFWRINGARHLPGRQLSILRALYLYREDMAERRDYPPFKIIGDATLIALVQASPRSEREMHGISGMTAGQVRRYGRGILRAINQGQRDKPPRRPPGPGRPDDDIVARYEALHDWRKMRARRRGVDSDIIVSRDILWVLAHQAPTSQDELQQIHGLGPWKAQTYGQEILDIITRTDNRRNGRGDGHQNGHHHQKRR